MFSPHCTFFQETSLTCETSWTSSLCLICLICKLVRSCVAGPSETVTVRVQLWSTTVGGFISCSELVSAVIFLSDSEFVETAAEEPQGGFSLSSAEERTFVFFLYLFIYLFFFFSLFCCIQTAEGWRRLLICFTQTKHLLFLLLFLSPVLHLEACWPVCTHAALGVRACVCVCVTVLPWGCKLYSSSCFPQRMKRRRRKSSCCPSLWIHSVLICRLSSPSVWPLTSTGNLNWVPLKD